MYETTYLESPIGWIKIQGSDKGIRYIQRIEKPATDKLSSHPLLKKCRRQLQEYFARRRTEFDIKLDWEGASIFYKSVWREVMKIPYGHTASYGAIAKQIGKPNASRAVGLANRNNPIAIIMPCHRVIGKSGKLTGYFYGLDIKQQLLELENPMSYAKQGKLF